MAGQREAAVLSKLLERFTQLCAVPSDINEHLPTLRKYARECAHVTEFGVRNAVSTVALAAGFPKRMVSYDIIPMPPAIERLIIGEVDFTFRLADVLQIEIVQTDLLFIDTLHTYDQLSAELAKHAGQVRKYIAFHDTETFGVIGEKQQRGIMPAIEEFLWLNPLWKVHETYRNNNGLMVLKHGSSD